MVNKKYGKAAFIHAEKYQKERKLVMLLLSDTGFYSENEVQQLIKKYKNKK